MYQGMLALQEYHFRAICELGNSNIALLMVKTVSIFGGVDVFFATSLSVTSLQGYLDTVQILLQHGAAVDQATKDGRTPLCIAS